MANELTLDNFASKLVGDIKDTITKEVQEDAKKALRDAINTTVYLQKKNYVPTYDVLNAVEIMDFRVGREKATFRIAVNASKLGVDMSRPWDWNAHGGVEKGGSIVPFTEGLIEVLDQGTKKPSPYYNHDGYAFFDKAYEDIERNLIVTMANSLRAKGWEVEVN